MFGFCVFANLICCNQTGLNKELDNGTFNVENDVAEFVCVLVREASPVIGVNG